MERSGQLLNRVGSVFGNLTGANTNDTLKALDKELAPKLSAHSDSDPPEREAVCAHQGAVRQARQAAPGCRIAVPAERYHTDFVRAGAQLSAADKEKLKA
jgi:peptidyl-dipeptidase Dcp